ncbi:MAG TPA: hypothetical protein VGM32_22205 [Rhodopila sp.]
MKTPTARDEISTKVAAPSELMPDQLEQIAGGARHKLDIKYGGPNGFYYPPVAKS